jgi:hypothetical protein
MPELTKDFLLSWAQLSIKSPSALSSAKNELSKEAAALQQLEEIERTELSTQAKIREIAFRLALAEYQISLEHA